MKQWDIFWFEVPFSNFRGSKERPVLIISPEEISEFDCLVAIITSQQYSDVGDYWIDRDHAEFEQTGLPKPSTIRLGKIVTITRSLLGAPLGSAGPEIQKEIKDRLKYLFGL